MSGCSTPVATQAHPTTQQPKITLILRAWGWGSTRLTASQQTVLGLQYAATAPWRAKHRGVDITVVPNIGGPQEVATAIIGGAGPDVYHSWHPGTIFASSALTTDLAPYIRQNNSSLSVFNRAQMKLFELPNGIRALPCYLGIVAPAINYSVLDSLGLSYPSKTWTAAEYASLCTSVASGSGGKIIGGALGLSGFSLGADMPAEFVLQGFGGSYQNPGKPSQCTLDSPECVAAYSWLMGLAKRKIVTGPGISGSLSKGTLAVQLMSTWSFIYAASVWRSLKWDFVQMPSFPKTGPATFATSDFYAMNPNTKHASLAWELLSWLSFEPEWQRSQISIFLLSPALMALWSEWEHRVAALAPPLAGKNLAVFANLARSGKAYPTPFFQHSNSLVRAALSKWGQAIWNQSVGVHQGLAQATTQVNAINASATKLAAQAAALAHTLKSIKPGPTTHYPPPHRKGQGVPYTVEKPYFVSDKKTGTYTLLADGWDVYLASDNCTFACAPITNTEGKWVCRVTAIGNLTCPHLSQWFKAGIMVRSDLSDDAKMASAHVTGAHAIEWAYRMNAGQTPAGVTGAPPPVGKSSGMATLTKPNTKTHKNYLVQPLWLMLSRKGIRWTAFASLDGKHWTQIGSPAILEVGGAWIGIMATSHNGSFKDKGYGRAVFDKLSFSPTEFVQLGRTGVPPSAGTVPAKWATMA